MLRDTFFTLFSGHLHFCYTIQDSLEYWCRQKLPSLSAGTCLRLSWKHHGRSGNTELSCGSCRNKFIKALNHHKTQSTTITLFKNMKVSGMVSTHLCVPEAHHGARDVLRYLRSAILGANNRTCAAVQRKKGQQITAASIC